MKKNSSCRTIKTNFSPSSAFLPQYQKLSSPLYKKSPTIDLCTARQQPQKIQVMPSSAKYSAYSSYFNRKKGLSHKKGLANEVNQINLNDITNAQNGIAPFNGGQGYNTLKNKINDLEGRLLEIKKNFQNSFVSKKSKNEKDKSYMKSNKENEPIQAKERTAKPKLVLDLPNKQNLDGNYKINSINMNSPMNAISSPFNHINAINSQQNRQNHSKSKASLAKINSPKNIDKQDISQMQNVQKIPKEQVQAEKNKNNLLQEYVTTFTCEPRNNMLLQCTSEANLLKGKQKQHTKKNQNKYYISQVINSFYSIKPSSFDQLCKNHLITSIDILSYIKNSNKQVSETVSIRPLPKAHRQTIIFDLDQTLIHCNQNTSVPFDVSLPIKFPNNTVIKAGINVRPYARECLKELAKYFQIIVFTASHECYANVIVDFLDPEKEIISHRYFRDSCFRTQEGFYVKDLRVVDRDLRNVLLVDNAAYSYCFQLDNGVPIIPFYDNKADLELKSLVNYLKQFVGVRDMRVKNGKEMKLGDYHNYRDPKTLISRLYEKD